MRDKWDADGRGRTRISASSLRSSASHFRELLPVRCCAHRQQSDIVGLGGYAAICCQRIHQLVAQLLRWYSRMRLHGRLDAFQAEEAALCIGGLGHTIAEKQQ